MLEKAAGLVLQEQAAGLAKAVVKDPSVRFDLRWDRYIRLSACAKALRQLAPQGCGPVLDAGGFDGALSLFLPEYEINVSDPATTGGDITRLDSQSFEIVVACDVIEHVEPRQRAAFIAQLGRVSVRACLVNYPLPATSTAQKVVAAVTGDPFVEEHIKFGLPYSSTVEAQFESIGFSCSLTRYGSRSLWAAAMALYSANQDLGRRIGGYLIEEHEHDQYPDPLYELVIAIRR